MDNLVCADCGTTYYSAAAPSMVERGERCDCGAPLRLVEQGPEVSVGAPDDLPRDDEGADPRGRLRFGRG